jgi:uncharacterized membrane protein YfhO
MFIVVPYFINNTPFIIGWDVRNQYSYFYELFINKTIESIHTLTFPFYSWELFLGNNYYTSKLFYYQNFYDVFLLLFNKLDFYKIQMLEIYVKFLVSGISFYFYSSYRKNKENTTLILSLLYVFSGFVIDAIKDPFFISFYTIAPLCFLMFEMYFKKDKRYLFTPFIVAILIITNYYQFYSLSLICVIYYFYRYREINESFKGVFKSSFRLIRLYLLGILLSSVVTVPNLFQVIGNERVFKSSSLLFFNTPRAYFALLTGLFTPNQIYFNRALDFDSIYNCATVNASSLNATLWSGSIMGLLLPQVLKDKKNRWILLLFTLLLFIPLGNSLIHGLSEPTFRWCQFIVFFNLTLIAKYLNDYDLIDKKLLKYSLIVIVVMLLLNSQILNLLVDEKNLTTHEYLLIIVFILFYILNYFLIKNNKKIFVIVVVELSLVSFLSIYDNPYYKQFDYKFVNEVNNNLGEYQELNKYIDVEDSNGDNNFYRVYVDYENVYWQFSPNMNLKYGFMPTMTYDSLLATSSSSLNELVDSKWFFSWSENVKDNNMLNLLSVKYAVVTDENQLPKGNYSYFRTFGDKEFTALIYKNDDYINFIKSYDKFKLIDDYSGSGDLLEYVISNEDLSEYITYNKNISINYVTRGSNKLDASVFSYGDTFVVTSLAYDKGWDIKINGEKVEYYQVNGGLTGFNLYDGTNTITMTFMPQGIKLGAVLTLFAILCYIIVMARENNEDI